MIICLSPQLDQRFCEARDLAVLLTTVFPAPSRVAPGGHVLNKVLCFARHTLSPLSGVLQPIFLMGMSRPEEEEQFVQVTEQICGTLSTSQTQNFRLEGALQNCLLQGNT